MIVYKGRLLKSKMEAHLPHPVNAGYYMAFKHSISLATTGNLVANFGCNRLTIMPDIVSKFFCAAL